MKTFARFLTLLEFVSLLGITPLVVAADTFGLVTAMEGPSLELHLGEGIESGRTVVVEPGTRMRVTDVAGNKYIIFGKALMTFNQKGQVQLHSGSLKVQSASGQEIKVHTLYMSGTVHGSAAVWISEGKTQWMTLEGASETWHPQLPQAIVQVATGYFTEISNEERHLQPHSPLLVEVSKAKAFLAKFGDPVSPNLFEHVATAPKHQEPKASRSIASVAEPVEVVEKADPEIMARLRAHIEGKDYEELKAELAQKTLENKKHQSTARLKYMSRVLAREQAYRKLMKSHGAEVIRAPASTPAPQVEVEGVDSVEAAEAKEAANVEQHGIISRLIKGDAHKTESHH